MLDRLLQFLLRLLDLLVEFGEQLGYLFAQFLRLLGRRYQKYTLLNGTCLPLL